MMIGPLVGADREAVGIRQSLGEKDFGVFGGFPREKEVAKEAEIR